MSITMDTYLLTKCFRIQCKGGTNFSRLLFMHSYLYAIERIFSSLKGEPTICTPTVIPSLDNPTGILTDGRPVLLNTMVFLNKASRIFITLPPILLTSRSSNLGAVIIVVGTTMTSTFFSNLRSSYLNSYLNL